MIEAKKKAKKRELELLELEKIKNARKQNKDTIR